jgi:CubicO group peptidase (beta-lactamase class C family)
LADRENRTSASEHTLYSVASVSKPVAATGLMVLKERKLIELDKPINDYLGDAKLRARVGDAAQATVRRVANHTAGLPLHYQFFYADEAYLAPTRDETIRRYGNLVTAPGERYQYSNLGYGVIDYVIERQSGKKFADFMREDVFLPLGMMHTSIDVGPGLEPHQAIRYTPDGKRIPFYDFDHPGASAVFASAHDLALFALFHMKEHLAEQRPILSDAAIDEMQVATASSQGDGGYGVGWGSSVSRRGYPTVAHSGGMPGVATLCSFVPSERVAVVVLCNTGSPLVGYVNDMIYKIMLPEEKKKADGSQGESGAGGGKFVPSAELLGDWKGQLVTYKSEKPLLLTVKESGDVHVKLGDQLETLLSGVSFRDGYLRGRFAGIVDYDDARGRPYQVQLELKLRDGVLNGSAITTTLPDGRGSSAVTHWAEVKREKAKSE